MDIVASPTAGRRAADPDDECLGVSFLHAPIARLQNRRVQLRREAAEAVRLVPYLEMVHDTGKFTGGKLNILFKSRRLLAGSMFVKLIAVAKNQKGTNPLCVVTSHNVHELRWGWRIALPVHVRPHPNSGRHAPNAENPNAEADRSPGDCSTRVACERKRRKYNRAAKRPSNVSGMGGRIANDVCVFAKTASSRPIATCTSYQPD